MRIRVRRRLILLGLTLPLLPGCFRYFPAPLEAVPPGEEVRVHLTRTGMASIPEELPTGGTFLTGRLVEAAAGNVTLRVPVAARTQSPATLELRQDLLISRADIVEVERRQLSRTRTGLAVAGAAAGATAIVLFIIEGAGRSGGPGDEPPDQMRVPLLRFAVP